MLLYMYAFHVAFTDAQSLLRLTGVCCYLLDVASEVRKAFALLLPFNSLVREVDGRSSPRFLLA